ncbi:hypothetical protein [Streptomyces griseoruber]|nr:hypothetical protein [Streptomyces griseoruber]
MSAPKAARTRTERVTKLKARSPQPPELNTTVAFRQAVILVVLG